MIEQCILCLRDFSVSEDLIPVPSKDQRGPRLFFINGTLHQFARRVSKNKKNKSGAFCLPPRKDPEPEMAESQVVEAPPAVIEEEHIVPIEESQPAVEVLAEKLQEHFSSDPRQTSEIPATEYSEYGDGEPAIGDVVDLVVVAFSTHDPTGQEPGGNGLARIPRRGSHTNGRRDGCRFREADIISLGVETLRPGSKIRARLVESKSIGQPFGLKDIEIYQTT